MEEFQTSSQSTDDEHPESNPEIIAIKSKIEETGSKLIILVEDLLKKYSFNENDEWKEEVMRKYAMPGAYMQPSAYLPCHLFREVWSRKKYSSMENKKISFFKFFPSFPSFCQLFCLFLAFFCLF